MITRFAVCFSFFLAFTLSHASPAVADVNDAVKGLNGLKPQLQQLLTDANAVSIRPSYCQPPDTPNKASTIQKLRALESRASDLDGEYWRYRRMIKGINDPWNRDKRSLVSAVNGMLSKAKSAIEGKWKALRSAPEHDCSPEPEPKKKEEITTGGTEPEFVRPPFTKPAPKLDDPKPTITVPKGPVCEEEKERLVDEAFGREHHANRMAQLAQNYVVDISREIAAYGGEPRPDSLPALLKKWEKISKDRLQHAKDAKAARQAMTRLKTKKCGPVTGGGSGGITTGGGGITTGGGSGSTGGSSGVTGGSSATGGNTVGGTAAGGLQCPQCDPIRRKIAAEQARKAQAEKDKADATRAHKAKLEELKNAEAKVKRLKKGLSGEEGIGAESTDPATGIRTTSYDNGEGQVEIKRFDRNGNQIGQTEYRRRPSTSKRRDALEKAEAEVKKINEALGQLNHAVYYADNRIEAAKKKIKELQQQLAACIDKCKKALISKPKTDVCVGGGCGYQRELMRQGNDDIEVELEGARSTSGTNAFDAKEVEKVGGGMDFEMQDVVIDGGPSTSGNEPMDNPGYVAPPPKTAIVVPSNNKTGTPPKDPKVEITTPQVPKEPKDTTPPPEPPLHANASGNINFTHVVRESPCPQAAGSINVSISTGNDFEIVSAKAMGNIASKLNVQVQGKKVVVQFNCSSPENGTFTGAIAITVRDKKTGKTASAPPVTAKGTVTGP